MLSLSKWIETARRTIHGKSGRWGRGFPTPNVTQTRRDHRAALRSVAEAHRIVKEGAEDIRGDRVECE